MRSFVLLSVVVTLYSLGCSFSKKDGKSHEQTLLIHYDNFGPQVMCYELIGFRWYQWDGRGDADSADKDIWVVVYVGSKADAMNRYPVNRKAQKDYRYVELKAAKSYFESKLRDSNTPANLHDEFSETLTLLNYFGARED